MSESKPNALTRGWAFVFWITLLAFVLLVGIGVGALGTQLDRIEQKCTQK